MKEKERKKEKDKREKDNEWEKKTKNKRKKKDKKERVREKKERKKERINEWMRLPLVWVWVPLVETSLPLVHCGPAVTSQLALCFLLTARFLWCFAQSHSLKQRKGGQWKDNCYYYAIIMPLHDKGGGSKVFLIYYIHCSNVHIWDLSLHILLHSCLQCTISDSNCFNSPDSSKGLRN